MTIDHVSWITPQSSRVGDRREKTLVKSLNILMIFLVSCVTSFPTVLSLKNVSDFVGLRYFLIGIFRNLIKISNQLSEKHDEMLGEILHLFINWDTVKKIQLRNKRLKSKLRRKYVLNLVNEPQQFATIKRLRNYLKSTSVF